MTDVGVVQSGLQVQGSVVVGLESIPVFKVKLVAYAFALQQASGATADPGYRRAVMRG